MTQYDVLGIGNAIVDVLAKADDDFLTKNSIEKGAMTLIDAGQADALYAKMAPGVEVSGGSAANTMAGVASLGGKGAYIGKVANDQLGGVFTHDIRAGGLAFTTKPLDGGAPTARCLILVTPDAQRTMNTFLGACVELGPDDIDEALVAASKVTYLEGYLFDPPHAKEAFYKAAKVAHQAGQKVALTLSDGFCVGRHRAAFLDLVEGHIDLLFANESEITSLYEVESFDEAVKHVKGHCEIAALTRSEKGSVIVSGDEVVEVPAAPIDKLIDTTGAGDLYAAGFLYGYTHGKGLAEAGRIASIAAAEVIQHYGARPETVLASLI
ncbi:MAG: adenosine kinase [Deltaproteobacteria bacterium]